MFLENLWYFRKELWRFRSWDYTFNLSLLARSLEKSANTLEFHGNEIEETRMKKVAKMKRVIEIIRTLDESSYISLAEKELGELKNVDGWFDDREDTPEEKLMLRSLDSYPYNQKLTDFFNDKEPEMEKSGKNEYVLTSDEVENFSPNEIKKTFNIYDEEENVNERYQRRNRRIL